MAHMASAAATSSFNGVGKSQTETPLQSPGRDQEAVSLIPCQSCSEMTIADIPGAELPAHKKDWSVKRLKMWLRSRNLAFKSNEQRSKLIQRVTKSRHRELKLIDPDPFKSYTRTKMAKCDKCNMQLQSDTSSTPSPDNQTPFSKSTTHIPKTFSISSITHHIDKSGKTLSVDRPNSRGYSFFHEGYIHKVLSRTNNSGNCEVQAHCYKSMKKNETPHQLCVEITPNGLVKAAKCSCIAGASGVCNHVFALLYLCNHVVHAKLEQFSDKGTCTDAKQEWNNPSKRFRNDGLQSEPIMGYTVFNPKYGSTSKGIKSALYEARAPSVQNNDFVEPLVNSFKADVSRDYGVKHVYCERNSYVDTILGTQSVLGSVLSYQCSITEGNFDVVSNFDCRVLNENMYNTSTSFPDLPICTLEPLDIHFGSGSPFVENLKLSKQDCTKLEEKTRNQSENVEWVEARKSRLTASNFGLICKRKTVTTKFVENLANPKNLDNVQAIKYGRENETECVKKYQTYMRNSGNHITVCQSGFVVNPGMPWAGCTPDRKVIDHKCGLNSSILLEVKCPHSFKELTPEELLQQDNFYMQRINNKPRLDRNHSYYYQVQGQLGLCGLTMCDFVVYTKRGLLIERIQFDEVFFHEMMVKLGSFYKDHFLVYITQTA